MSAAAALRPRQHTTSASPASGPPCPPTLPFRAGEWGIVSTPGGMRYFDWSGGWGNLRYSCNAAFLALLWAAQQPAGQVRGTRRSARPLPPPPPPAISPPPPPPRAARPCVPQVRSDALAFGRLQVDYALGRSGRSYVVGFGTNPPTHVGRPRGAVCMPGGTGWHGAPQRLLAGGGSEAAAARACLRHRSLPLPPSLAQAHHCAASCPDMPAPCGWDQFSAAGPNPKVGAAGVPGPAPSRSREVGLGMQCSRLGPASPPPPGPVRRRGGRPRRPRRQLHLHRLTPGLQRQRGVRLRRAAAPCEGPSLGPLP